MSKIQTTFKALRDKKEKALIPFFTAGDPHPDKTVEIMHALVESGADMIELGIPFSDPMADGPVIQRASERALKNNVGIIDSGYRGNIKGVFDNIQGYDFMDFTIEFASRLLQICPPNLEYPMKITIVNDILNLGLTNRGENGFGSTGN